MSDGRNAFWRSLVESSSADGEFPPGADRPPEGVGRRDFLRLLGASVALAGVGGCTRAPSQKILPYTRQPEDLTPGIAAYYATTLLGDGYAQGVIVETHEGRPTKIEGNPDHPANPGGATDAFAQAAVLGLYDPSRARAMRRGRDGATWSQFLERHGRPRRDRGAGLRFLVEQTTSPLVADLLGRVRAAAPEARFTAYSPTLRGSFAEAARALFGRPLALLYDLSAADVILILDDDLLGAGPMHLRYARQFAARRRPPGEMSRLYVVEAAMSPTGSIADHRLRRRSSEIAGVAAAIAAEVARSHAGALGRFGAFADDFTRAVARDLARARGRALVVAGDRQPPEVHALVHLMNDALGAVGKTVLAVPLPTVDAADAAQPLADLAAELDSGMVDTLVVLGGNPSYTAPADLDFARRLKRAGESLYLGLYHDETARDCTWFMPAAHDLESWGDARALDGTVSFQQPLIAPLYGGRTVAEVLAAFAGVPHPDAHALLRDRWRSIDLDAALQKGFIGGSAPPAVTGLLHRNNEAAAALARLAAPLPALEVDFRPSPTVGDGRFANNAWLLELPQPMTKLTWGNAAQIGPRTAARLGLRDGDEVALTVGGRTVEAPIAIAPGHADDAVTLDLGWGRRAIAPPAGASLGDGDGAIGEGVGFDAYRLRPARSPAFVGGASLRKLGRHVALARTQEHFALHGRPVVLLATLDEYRRNPNFAGEERRRFPSLMDPPATRNEQRPDPLQWAMSIDLGICTGCSSCMVACQAENNVPVVGRSGVLRSREMHWLRIDTYYTGAAEEPRALHQPMLCQHCEKAPCEYVCPVNATVHSPDGLNEMVYNRCVGTRFCQNNCPYKVRRFNFFNWYVVEPANQGRVELQRNPDVTVRERGVMEKCTFCVQRIREAEIAADRDGRALKTGDVRTACQQACPTGAIQFDALQHRDSAMAKLRGEPRAYSALNDLDTRPRIQYLARITNPNPELV